MSADQLIHNIGEGKNFYEFSGGSWSEIIQSGIPNEISIFGKSHILAENDIYTCGQYKVDHYNGDTWEEISTIGVLSNKLSSFWRWGEHTFVGGDYGEFKYNDGTDSTWYDALEVIFPEGLVDLNAIDFKKGCYVGQENTARMKLKNKLRRRLLPLKTDEEIKIGEDLNFGEIKMWKLNQFEV